MIQGTKFWNDKDKYYTQTNNAIEQILKKKQVTSWLEDCGPTTAINCLASLGVEVEKWTKIQPEDILSVYFNNPANHAELKKIRDLDLNSYMVNQIPQYYPKAVEDLFGARAEYFEGRSFAIISNIVFAGNAIQACLRKPGHYIAFVAFDNDTNEIIYNDPWPGRFADGNGFNKRMGIDEFKSNVCNYFIKYLKE